MFNLLQLEFNYGIFDVNGLRQFVGYGSITTDQYKQITGVDYQTAQAPQSGVPASSASATGAAPQAVQSSVAAK